MKPLLDPDAHTQLVRAERLLRWYERRSTGRKIMPLTVGQTVDIRDLEDYSGFGEGWSMPEDTGIWTEGPRAEVRIGLKGREASEEVLTLGLVMVCVDPDESLRVTLLANDKPVGARDVREFHHKVSWHVPLPSSVTAVGSTDLTLIIDEPRSPLARGWSPDPRELGVQLRTVSLGEADHSVRLGETVLFQEGSSADRFLGDGWSYLEPNGVWTVGEHARLILELIDTEPTDLEIVLDVGAFLTAEHPKLEVTVSARDQRVGGNVFRHGEQHPPLRFRLPRVLIDPDGRAVLDLLLGEPASPVRGRIERGQAASRPPAAVPNDQSTQTQRRPHLRSTKLAEAQEAVGWASVAAESHRVEKSRTRQRGLTPERDVLNVLTLSRRLSAMFALETIEFPRARLHRQHGPSGSDATAPRRD